jgi:hypothetical protein
VATKTTPISLNVRQLDGSCLARWNEGKGGAP